jgi:hypothetical protein
VLNLITYRCGSALHTTLCYGQWSLRVGNGHFQHLAEQKTINRSKQKFVQLIVSAGSPSKPKFLMIGWRVAAPHMGEVVDWQRFPFSGDFSGKRTADPERSSPTYYTSVDAVSTKDVPLGSHRYVSSYGVDIPKNPSSWGLQWGFPA